MSSENVLVVDAKTGEHRMEKREINLRAKNPDPVSADIAEIDKLITHAKTEGWI